MSIRIIIAGLILLAFSSLTSADIIYLKSGNKIEVEGAEIKGDLVVFTVFNGKMSIELSAVTRIEKSTGPVRPDAGLRNSVSGTPYSGTTAARAGVGGSDEAPGNQAGQDNKEIIDFYIKQKFQLQKEIKFYDVQISTLQSTIYAKSAIFSDTTEDNAQLVEMQNAKRVLEERMQTLLDDARRAGLDPGHIRQIEDARETPNPQGTGTITTVGAPQRDRRNANVKWLDDEDDDRRNSKTVLEEGKDDKGRPPE